MKIVSQIPTGHDFGYSPGSPESFAGRAGWPVRTLGRRLLGICFWFVAIALLGTIAVQAHDPGLSSMELRFEERRLVADLTFARGDIESLIPMDTGRDGRITSTEFNAARPRLEDLARDALQVLSDGHVVSVLQVEARLDESNNIHFQLSYPRRPAHRFALRLPILASLSPGHRHYLVLRDAEGNLLAESMLRAGADSLEIDSREMRAVSRRPTVGQFLVLGVQHILTGYDHLVFLIGLLLAGAGLRMALKIITSFTVAHSLTLALATLNVIQIPSRVVEPLIAISIVYVGLENLWSQNLARRWLLTFAFGLVHGFGFASVLQELGIGSAGNGVVVPLLSFNLGVEFGQVAIAAVALPLIWHLRRHPSFVARYAPACSVLVTLAGGYWFVARTLLR